MPTVNQLNDPFEGGIQMDNLIKYIELAEHRNIYCDMVKGEDKSTLLNLYKTWEVDYYKVGTSLINNSVSLQGHMSALKDFKVDPYIAGGAINGITGSGFAGVAGAISADARNQQIDQKRDYWNKKVFSTGVALKSAESALERTSLSIIDILNKYPACVKIREDYYKSKYDEATRLFLSKSYDQAIEKYTVLGDYKDSKSMIKACKSAKHEKKASGTLIASVILAFFLDLISGCLFISLEAAVSVFVIGFIISYIFIKLSFR